MLTSGDLEFGKKALNLGFIESEQLAKSIRIQKKLLEKGKKIRLYWIMYKKNYLDKYQIKIIQDSCENITGANDETDDETFVYDNHHSNYVNECLSKLKRYDVVKKISGGAFAEIFLVRDKNLGREVALKIMKKEVQIKNSVERFIREAQLVSRLRHPQIVMLFDMINEDDALYFTMEYIKGRNLKHLIANRDFSIKESVHILLKIASAITFAHQENVIHRDLKPENIMMEKGINPKVTDFGLAKIADTQSNISRAGMIMGTLQYMPPEQAEGRISDINQQSDLYSMGAILYELLTKKPPFQATQAYQLISQILNSDPIPPRKINSLISPKLEKIVLKALEKSQSRRYKNVSEFVNDLARI